MSNTYARFIPMRRVYSNDLSVTAFVGGKKYGNCVQLTIDHKFIELSEYQVYKLINVLEERLRGNNITATGYKKMGTYSVDGETDYDE